jgi:hypothetical protein
MAEIPQMSIFNDFDLILKCEDDLGVDRIVVDNGFIYLPVHFQLNRGINARENGRKLSKKAKNPQK